MRTSATASVPTLTHPGVTTRTDFMSCIQRGWPSMAATSAQTRSIGASMTIIDSIGSGSAPAGLVRQDAIERIADPGADEREPERAADHRGHRRGEGDTGGPHLVERAVAVARFKVDGADGVGQDLGLEAEPDGVERGRLDAVVGGEPDDDDALDAGVAQERLELGGDGLAAESGRAS